MKKTLLMVSLLAGAVTASAQTVLHNNGPFITNPGAGSGGANVSAIQPGLSNYGFNHRQPSNIRVAEDIVIPAGQTWDIDSLVFYAYQTGSTTTSTINHVNVRIWNGVPGAPGSLVVFGDSATNRLANSTFTGIFRTTGTDFTNSDRPVMRNAVNTAGLALTEGTYWVDWQSNGTLASGPWVPPVAVAGQPSTGNARQFTSAGNWAAVMDGPSAASLSIPVTLPFLVKGTVITTVNDVSISAINSPANGCINSLAQICAVIKNYGTVSQSNIPISYSINGGTSVSEVFAGPLAAGADATYCFTGTANLGTAGNYTLNVSTSLAGDEVSTNNVRQRVVTVTNLPNVTLTSLQADYCTNANNVTLNGAPGGGTYTGPGITGNSFSPSAAGAGTHSVTYTYTNSSGCSNSITRTVTINQAPVSGFTMANTDNVYTFTNTSTGATSYNWNFGEGNTSTDPNPTHTFTTSGNYTVTLVATAANGCTSSTTEQISVISGVAHALEAAVSVFPNPSAGNFTVTLPATANASVEVTNLLGQAIYRAMNEQADVLQVNLPEMAKGVYLVKVTYQDHSLIRRIVIE